MNPDPAMPRAFVPSNPSVPTGNPARRWVRPVVVVLLVLALILVARRGDLREWVATLLQRVEAWGAWGVVVFIGAYVLAAVLLIPGSALTLGAGAVFGLARGTVIVSIASTLAAAAAFLIGRHGARQAVARKIEANPKFAALDHAVAQQGWKIVLLTRLSPVFPYTLLNYGFGLTRVSFVHYVLASWVGMLPGTVMYVYLGTLARVAADRSRTPMEWALYAVGLAATLAVTVLITRTARRVLARQRAMQENPHG